MRRIVIVLMLVASVASAQDWNTLGALWSEVSALWTPKNGSFQLWLDASDSGFTNTQLVASWVDKCGISNAVSESSVRSPIFHSNLLNGFGGCTFDGSTTATEMDGLYTARRITTNCWAVFVVCSAPSQANNALICQHDGGVDLGRLNIISAGASGGTHRMFFNNGASYNLTGTNVAFNGTAKIVATTATTTPNYFWRVDGLVLTTNLSQSLSALDCPIKLGSQFKVGNTLSYNNAWTGTVFEVLLSTNVLQESDLQRIEGYLAWKWGLQGSLPSNHPYKGAAP